MDVYCLVDCNNFYCSCERIFNPALVDQPIVVLSNNDGCVVSRSNEAKVLGIPMGMPLFKIPQVIQKRLHIFSSNYALYGDISNRMMTILSNERAELEIYSIDEAFLHFKNIDDEEMLFRHMKELRDKIFKWVGIPVTVGMSPTRTLSKLACDAAKQRDMKVMSFIQPHVRKPFFKNTPVFDIWGIGRKSGEKLCLNGIRTAQDILDSDPKKLQNILGIIGKRKYYELMGVDSLESECDFYKDSISSSKSFSGTVTELEELESAVISFATRCQEKLRAQKSVCHYVSVFLTTGPFSDCPYYANQMTGVLDEGSDSLQDIIGMALKVLKAEFRPGYEYKKVGVTISHFILKNESQLSLFAEKSKIEYDDKLMDVMDSIKKRMGRDTIKFGVTKEKAPWAPNANYKSRLYTTSWSEILKVKS